MNENKENELSYNRDTLEPHYSMLFLLYQIAYNMVQKWFPLLMYIV